MAGFSVNIGAEIAPLTAGLNQAKAEVKQFSAAVEAAAPTTALTTLNNVVSTTAHSFDELAASAAALARIEASINQAGDAAINAGSKFDTLGGRLPLQDFNQFKTAFDRFKRDVDAGVKFKITPGGLIPPIPPTVPASINATTAALNNLNKGASAANGAVQDFSRIIQDLPFGTVGVINNVQQLPGSLQRLSAAAKESGKSVGSLLLSSITGFGGVGLAISALTSGLLIYQNGIVGFTSKTKAAKDEAQKLAELLQSVKSAAETAFEGIGGSQGEIIQVQALAAAVGDETRSQIERGRALEKLKSINKEYFGDLKLEEDSLRSLTPLVNEYTNALIQQAIVRELQSEIGKIGAVFVKQAKAVSDAKDALSRYKESLNISAIDKAGNRVFVLDSNIDALNLNLKQAQNALAPTAAKFNELSNAIKDATVESLKYKSATSTPDKKEEDLLKKRLDALEKIKAITKDATALVGLQEAIFELQVKIAVRDQVKNQLSKAEVDQLIEGYRKELQKAFDQQAIELEAIPKVKFSQVNRAELPSNIDSVIAKATGLDKKVPVITIPAVRIKFEKEGLKFNTPAALINAFEAAAESFKLKARGILQAAIVDSFVGLGEGIGEGLAKGDITSGIAKAGENILHIIGAVIADIGKQMIMASKLVITLQKILESAGFGPASLGVGVALVAVGTAIKNVKFNTPKFATGGIVTGPLIGQIGEMHRPEVIMPLDRLPQMLRSIGGGGGNEMQLIPIINNEGLYLAMKRGERRAGRKF
jgi:hypothetical protein